MPGLNGSGFTNSYNSSLGEAESAILDAGVPLYELKPTTVQYYNDKIMGLWAVKVNHMKTANNKIRTSVDWYNQKGAYVVVDVFGKGGKRFAYVPDDSVWHNRMGLIPIVLGNKPVYEVLRYHTQDGFSGGARAIKELVMLRDLTQEWIVWHSDKKIEVFRSFDGTECDSFIEDARRKDKANEVQIVGGAEVVVRKAQMYKESDHLELRCVKIPQIQKIIDRAKLNWILDDEWTKEVLPDIQKKIKDHFGEADMKARRAEALRYLPEIQEQLNNATTQLEQLKPLVELMKDPKFASMIAQFAPGVATAAAKASDKVNIVSDPVSDLSTSGTSSSSVDVKDKVAEKGIEPPATHTDLGEVDITTLNITTLRQVAKNQFGIKGVDRKSQEALIAEIREKQGIPDEEASDEADTISVDD